MSEPDLIAQRQVEFLKKSPYECFDIKLLLGGSANFIYRGKLRTPLPESDYASVDTVIIKHAEPYIKSLPSWEFSVDRAGYEAAMLRSLGAQVSAAPNNSLLVTTPQLHYYESSRNSLVVSDYKSSLDLKSYLLRYGETLSKSQARAIGSALGHWIAKYHAWSAAPLQSELREFMYKNEAMVTLKWYVNYGRLEETIEKFPTILKNSRDLFRKVAQKQTEVRSQGKGRIIHGDFWTGNILLTGESPDSETPKYLVIIDWEMSQLGHPGYDLGQVLAELYLLKHFCGKYAAQNVASALLRSYGYLTDEYAFTTAVAWAVHIIIWPCRVESWGKGPILEECVEYGNETLKHAWKKDKEWFRGGILQELFRWD